MKPRKKPKKNTSELAGRHKSTCKNCGTVFPGRRKYCEKCWDECTARDREEKHEKYLSSLPNKLKELEEKLEEKTCLFCGKKFKHIKNIFCNLSCANSRSPLEKSKLKASISSKKFHDSPEGAAFRSKNSRFVQNLNNGKVVHDVPRDEYAVTIPTVHFDDEFEFDFPGYSKGEKW